MHLAVAILHHELKLCIRKVLVHDAVGQRAVLLHAVAMVQFEGRKSFVAGGVAHV